MTSAIGRVMPVSVLHGQPDSPDLLRLGVALHGAERFAEAVAVYEQALGSNPDFGAAWHNRGNSLLELGRWEEAIGSYRAAIRLIPAFAEGHVTIATALQSLHRPYEAMASCHRALAIDPSCAEAHWNLALALLQVGALEEGWEEFEWRWEKRGFTSRKRDFRQPAWNGDPLPGQTLLVHAEQGFGDSIQFARFISRASERVGRIVVECPAPLKDLLTGVRGVGEVVASGEELPPFDSHLPLMSLPRVLGTRLRDLPGEVAYVRPPRERQARWSARIGAGTGLKIGLVWAGRKRPDPNRTCPLAFLRPLAGIAGISLYSLQVGEITPEDRAAMAPMGILDPTGWIGDFSDTAALISQLDLVISIDTGVAHLAGAMGKKTWVMLPYAADWRWMLDRDDSPWYPTMRLFRQELQGDWRGVVARLVKALQSMTADSAP